MKRTCRRVRFGDQEAVTASADILKYLTDLLTELPKVEVLYDSVLCLTKNEAVLSLDQQAWPADFPYAARYYQKKILFKTRWHGWPPSYDSWEPYENFNEDIFRDMLITLAIKLYLAAIEQEKSASHTPHTLVRDLIRKFPTDERLIKSLLNHSLTVRRSRTPLARDDAILSMTEPPPIDGSYWAREYHPDYKNIGFSHFRLPRPIPPETGLTPATAFSRFAGPSAFQISLPSTYRRILPAKMPKTSDLLQSKPPPASTNDEQIILQALLTPGGQLSLLNDVNAREVFNFLWPPPPMSSYLKWHSGTLLPSYSTYIALVPDKISCIVQAGSKPIALTHFKPYYGSGVHTPAWITLDHLNQLYPFLLTNYLMNQAIKKAIEETEVSFDLLLTSRIFEPDLIAELYERGGSPELSRVVLEWTCSESVENWALLTVRGGLADCHLVVLTLMCILETAECVFPGGSATDNAIPIRGSDCRLAVFLPISENPSVCLNLAQELEGLTSVSYPPFRTHPANLDGFEPVEQGLHKVYSRQDLAALTTPLVIFDRASRCAHAITIILERLVRSHLSSTCLPELQLADWYAKKYNQTDVKSLLQNSPDLLKSPPSEDALTQLSQSDVKDSLRHVLSVPSPQLPQTSAEFREVVHCEERLWSKFVNLKHPYLTRGPPPNQSDSIGEDTENTDHLQHYQELDGEDDGSLSELFDGPSISFNSYLNKLGREKAFDLMQKYARLAFGYPAAMSPNDQCCQSCMTIDRWGNLTIGGGSNPSSCSRGYYIGPPKDSDDVPGHLSLLTEK